VLAEFIESKLVKNMLINLSNHPSKNWSREQLNAAIDQFGEVVDMAFPNVPPTASSQEVDAMVTELFNQLPYGNIEAIHVMGEMTLVYKFVTRSAIPCIASTTERISIEKLNEDGSSTKTFTFKFIQFRNY
jgi:hypothetical protein